MSNEQESGGTITPMPSATESSPVKELDAVELRPPAPSLKRSELGMWVREGFRAGVLRKIATLPAGPSALSMLAVWIVVIAISLALERAVISGDVTFQFQYWLYRWTITGITISFAWLILTWRSQSSLHPAPVAAWILLTTVGAIPAVVVYSIAGIIFNPSEVEWTYTTYWIYWGAYFVICVWTGAVVWRVARAVNREKLVAVALVLLTFGTAVLRATVLNIPAWQPDYSGAHDDDAAKSNILTLSQEVFESQQALLADALSKVEPSKGKSQQFYAVIYAPYSQDVFVRESAMVQELLEQRFGATGHTIRLVNSPSTTDTIPWATKLNLQRSLNAIATAMNKEHDVLVVYMTSHGGADFKLSAMHYPLEVEELTAEQLGTYLADAGIKNRVIAVSACYSGGWIEPLKSDNTLVMTAADKDHTSYGCGSKSELTFFGRAVFDEQLRKTLSFEEAFKAAVPIIESREKEAGKNDGFSNPQISVGAEIKQVLDTWMHEHESVIAPVIERSAN